MKKVQGKSLSVQLRKNSVNFISNGPILLVWVTQGKFALEGLIQKLFTVKPRAIVQGSEDLKCFITPFKLQSVSVKTSDTAPKSQMHGGLGYVLSFDL